MEPEQKTELERLSHLADELDNLQADKNQGRGVNHLRYVVDDLKRGDIDTARADITNQADKFDSIQDIKEWVIGNLFGDIRHPWESEEEYRKRLRN